MAITFKDGREYLGLWFVPTIEGEADFMAAAFRDDAAEPFQILYRFRYYASQDPFEKDDMRSWYEVTRVPDELVLATMELVVEGLLKNGAVGPRYFVDLSGTRAADEMLRRCATQPWFHIQHKAST